MPKKHHAGMMRMVGLLGFILVALMAAALAREAAPHVWLQGLIVLWAAPLALAAMVGGGTMGR